MNVEIEDKDAKMCQMAWLLLEVRDALPAITVTAARLHSVDLSLAERIESALTPWLVADDDPTDI